MNVGARPAALAQYPYWTTTYENMKRPTAAPGDHNLFRCKTLDCLAPRPTQYVGVNFTLTEHLACIDVDCPDDHKEDEPCTPRELLETEWMQDILTASGLLPWVGMTYIETSPSGKGLHIWLLIPDKQLANGASFIKSTCPRLKGQLSLSESFMTSTGIHVPQSPQNIAVASVTSFPLAFSLNKSEQSATLPLSIAEMSDGNAETEAPIQVISESAMQYQALELSKVAEALSLIPASPDEKLTENWQQLTRQTYEHYSFWLTVGMALHHYGAVTRQLLEVYELYLDWSRTDTVGYTSDDDVYEHWKSFDSSDAAFSPKITARTLIKLSNMFGIVYPRPKLVKGKPSKYPEVNEYENFSCLLNHFGIELFSANAGKYYVSGHKQTLERYFRFPGEEASHTFLGKYYGLFSVDQLCNAALCLCQANNWRGLSLAQVRSLVSVWIGFAEPLDMLTLWLDTPWDKLPEEYHYARGVDGERFELSQYNDVSTLDTLYEALDVRYISPANEEQSRKEEEELYRACLEKILYHMLKYREPHMKDDSGGAGMLILVGPEYTYKSTFCRLLLPEQLKPMRKTVNLKVNGDKAERDFARDIGSRAIVIMDEFEGMVNMKNQSSYFKNLLAEDDMSFTDIYKSDETTRKRKAIILGTTNEHIHVLSSEGSRRMWFIPTGTIDTHRIARFNLHHFYNQLRDHMRAEYTKGNNIWRLSKAQAAIRSQWNESRAATTAASIELEHVWQFGMSTMPKGYLDGLNLPRRGMDLRVQSTMQVKQRLEACTGSRVNAAQLKHELTRACAQWTGTMSQDLIVSGVVTVIKGRACQNWYEPRKKYQYEYWVMPPLCGDALQIGGMADGNDE